MAFLESFLNLISSPYQNNLRQSLGLSSEKREDFDAISLSRNRLKNSSLTYKITFGYWLSRSFVVKFAPPGKHAHGSWYDVKDEFVTLKYLHTYGDIPVPKPIYQSTNTDESTVGRSFIIMEYVEGQNFKAAGDVPTNKRFKAFQSVMNVLSKLHKQNWVYANNTMKKYPNESSEAYWSEQVTTWDTNWRHTGGYDYQTSHGQLFSAMMRGRKLSGRSTQIIHGDMNISNVIFDNEFNVKAIVDWKYGKNGDPMSDVAYFLMMFLNPSDYGISGLNCYPLTIVSDHNTSENTILDAYKRQVGTLDERAYNYAKAVACLRLIYVYKNAQEDGFRGHELGSKEFQSVTGSGSQQSVLTMLTKAGQRFYAVGSY